MAQVAGPFALVPGTAVSLRNPAASGGNLVSTAVVLVNFSPYELVVTGDGGEILPPVDPLTRDLAQLSSDLQQIVVTPVSLGVVAPPGQSSDLWAIWYSGGQTPPANLPVPIETGAVTALAPLGVATTSLPSGTEGIAYAATTAATGGLVPYTWELAPASGPLPTGLAISPAGVISGTPTAAGAFQFTVQVTDSEGDTATQPLAIMVASSGGGGVDQAAAWGLPVQTSTTGAQATYAIPLAGVTSGQPILLFHMNLGGNYLGANPIVDNFATPYNWRRITGVKQTRALEAWIGTGGAGTGGTITVTTGDSVNTTTGLAVPAQGASTAAGLGAVDVSGVASSASTVTIAMPVLLTGPAGDAVFYVCSQGSVALQTGTYINVYPFAQSTGLSALLYCLASGLPNNDTCQPSWNNQTAGLYAAVGVALKAAA